MSEFIYRYNLPNAAHVFISFVLETNSRAREVQGVLNDLKAGGMNGVDISDDEMTKSHLRYMIGGSKEVSDERIFRFRE